MRTCCKCKKNKKDCDFNYKNKAQNIRHSTCKECTREQIKNHYNKNRDYYLNKARSRNRKQREEIRKIIWAYLLEHPCVDCGERDPVVLDFDHQTDKIAPISLLIKQNQSKTKLRNEIEKCVVRCANCHRRKTAKDYNWYKHNYASVA